MANRQPLHELVDVLPESEVDEAKRVLEALCSGGVEIDIVSPQDLAEIDEARAEIRRGEWASLEQIKNDNGL